MDELLAWNAPVRWLESGRSKANSQVVLMNGTANRVVPDGAWICTAGGQWWLMTTDELKGLYEEDVIDAEIAGAEVSPFPSMQHFTISRVGFRKHGPRADVANGPNWVWREEYAGLTRAELQAGGWEPIYVITEGGR
jgi:hypothetical protein